jgi:hypothetical protein
MIEESGNLGVIDNDGVETWHCHVSTRDTMDYSQSIVNETCKPAGSEHGREEDWHGK